MMQNTHRVHSRNNMRSQACVIAAVAMALVTLQAQAAVITVGAGSGYDYTTVSAAIAAAQSNDNIRIAPGTYQNDFATVNIPLTIEGDGGLAVLEATILIPNGKAILVTNADVTIRNIEFRGSAVPDGNGAGVRVEGGDLTVEDSIFRNDQNGILASTTSQIDVIVRNSSFINTGGGDGTTHALYVNRIASLTVQDSVFDGTHVGHDIKSRAATTVITGNTLDDGEIGTTSYAIDVPNGGNATIIGNVIRQGANTENPTMVAYGAEGNLYLDGTLLVANNTFINTRPGSSIGVFNHTSTLATLQNNTFDGVATPLLGPGTITTTTPGSAPEPAAAGLLGAALLGWAYLNRRRKVFGI